MNKKKLILGALALILSFAFIASAYAITSDDTAELSDDGVCLGASGSATVGSRFTLSVPVLSRNAAEIANDDLYASLSGAPSWVSISGNSVTGVPTAAGTYTFTVNVRVSVDSSAYDSESVTLRVSSASSGTTTYTITYNTNGATYWGLDYTKRTVSSGTTITLPGVNDIVKAGYTFQGWKIGSTVYTPGASYTVNSNVTAAAQWSVRSVDVTYNANGGDGTFSETVSYDSSITLPSSGFSKPGYELAGWTSGTYGNIKSYACGEIVSITGTITFYAVWKEPVVSFDCDEAVSYISSDAGELALINNSITLIGGTHITLPSLSTRLVDGWVQVVVNWRDQAGNAADFDYIVTKSVTLSPVWNDYFRVNVSDPSATIEIDSQFSSYHKHTVNWGDGYASTADNLSDPLTHTYQTNAAYGVTVSSTSFTRTVSAVYPIDISAASDSIDVVTITFNSNGGSDVPSQTIAVGSSVIAPVDPYKPGYSFLGWYTNEGLTEEYDFTTPVSENLTLYASYIDIGMCVVSFETNGGSVIQSQQVKIGTAIVKPSDPTKSGYSFSGWYLNSDLTVPYDFNTILNENITLYADWDKSSEERGSFNYFWLFLLIIIAFVVIAVGRDVSR